MKKPALAVIGATLATAGMAALAAAVPPAADARPRPFNCAAIYQTMSDSADLAQAAYAEGDEKAGDEWMKTYWVASRNHSRLCAGK